MGYFEGDWWPVSPKLFFDQMAAPVPEIMATTFIEILIINNNK
jgi:hypothetical protein